jgi:hypothetical protein
LKRDLWKDDAKCLDLDTNLYFEGYEDNVEIRDNIDSLCSICPVAKVCFANGIAGKEWGIWGGVYLENGDISREFNKHKTKEVWGKLWKSLTTETQ